MRPGPLIDATTAVLEARTADERGVIDAFLDDMLAAVGGVAGQPQNRGAVRAPPRLAP
ncbi:hypothetical protein [Blastococcus saxobsidens]|uniref:hypothetical protein n=1 Tax=Blastococcus saxobsidens TaxID=138336 RepID=UPI0002DD92C6|nr:hypothetical protein [Blastococcus saxobsidens]